MKSFEERLGRLEEINDKIRQGDVPLEEAAELFEEGIKLAQNLDKDLSKIERRIEQLMNEPTESGEKPVLELFPDLSHESQDD
jgi:exodeoxyribonuclease VII small subunit